MSLNSVTSGLTSLLLCYKVLKLKKSGIQPNLQYSCQIIQLISTIAVIESYLIFNTVSALISGYQLTNECTINVNDIFQADIIHFMHFFITFAMEMWYLFDNSRVEPQNSMEIDCETSV